MTDTQPDYATLSTMLNDTEAARQDALDALDTERRMVEDLRDERNELALQLANAQAERDLWKQTSANDGPRIEGLVGELGRAKRELEDARCQHQEDVDLIGNALLAEAEERDWCSLFDEFVGSLNRNLHIPLPERAKLYEATITYTVNIKIPFEAPDAAAARAKTADLYEQIDERRLFGALDRNHAGLAISEFDYSYDDRDFDEVGD